MNDCCKPDCVRACVDVGVLTWVCVRVPMGCTRRLVSVEMTVAMSTCSSLLVRACVCTWQAC